MTAAFASSRHEETRAEQLESLRGRMASISEKKTGPAVPDDLLDSESWLALPQWLADLSRAPPTPIRWCPAACW
jgi:hypothetical protein